MHQEVRATKKGAGAGNKGSRNEIDHVFFATSCANAFGSSRNLVLTNECVTRDKRVWGQRLLLILVNQNSGDTLSNASGFNTK